MSLGTPHTKETVEVRFHVCLNLVLYKNIVKKAKLLIYAQLPLLFVICFPSVFILFFFENFNLFADHFVMEIDEIKFLKSFKIFILK